MNQPRHCTSIPKGDIKRLPLLPLVCIVLVTCDSSDSATDPEPITEWKSLGEVAPYPVGVAIQSGHIASVPRTGLISRVFSSITAEYEMKMNPMSRGQGSYAWEAADQLVNFAEKNDMQVHGHALVWHQTTPAWLESFGGNDHAFEEAVRDYVTIVVERYAGKVVSWDVVNEAFEDGSGEMRQSVFRRRMGPDYVARLFQYARDADSDALLFYNDYGSVWDAAKGAAILDMVDDFQRRGVPIDGVGLQTHITYTFPPLENLTGMMDELVERGLKIHLSELDVRVNPNGDIATLTDTRSEEQKARIKAVVHAFNQLPEENRFAITVWGLLDPDSWLIDFWGNPEWPLLFDSQLRPKPAYFGFLEALEEDF